MTTNRRCNSYTATDFHIQKPLETREHLLLPYKGAMQVEPSYSPDCSEHNLCREGALTGTRASFVHSDLQLFLLKTTTFVTESTLVSGLLRGVEPQELTSTVSGRLLICFSSAIFNRLSNCTGHANESTLTESHSCTALLKQPLPPRRLSSNQSFEPSESSSQSSYSKQVVRLKAFRYEG
jgi:hypothetical protein